MRPYAGHPLTTSHTHPNTHMDSAISHKVKSFSRVQRLSKTPQIYMNLRRLANDEGKDNFLQWDMVSMCMNGFMSVCVCVFVSLSAVCVEDPESSLAHMPSVTQPSQRNPKLGRLVCTHNLWPLCSPSSTWHPLAAGAKRVGRGCRVPSSATQSRYKVKWRSRFY